MNVGGWLANAVVLFTVVTCTRLGFWQLDRWDQKITEAERRQLHHDLPELSTVTGDLRDYRRVRLRGRYTDAMVATGGVPFRLNGYAALGVFQIDGGPRVLVQRGWIPVDDWTRFLESPDEQVITGVLAAFDGDAGIAAIDDPRTGQQVWPLGRQPLLWFFSRGVGIPWPSIAAAHQVDVRTVVVRGPELPSLEERGLHHLPAGGYTTWLQTEHHHHYALQWFAFAAIAAGLRGWFVWRQRR